MRNQRHDVNNISKAAEAGASRLLLTLVCWLARWVTGTNARMDDESLNLRQTHCSALEVIAGDPRATTAVVASTL
jgi:hypothetical protein